MKPSAIALVKAVAFYESGIWPAYKSCHKSKTVDELFEISLGGSNEFGKIHTRFSKCVLRVNSITYIFFCFR